jgi:hypothetical protein
MVARRRVKLERRVLYNEYGEGDFQEEGQAIAAVGDG